MFILSFDCAYKSLGISLIEIKESLLEDTISLCRHNLNTMDNIFNKDNIIIHYFAVCSLFKCSISSMSLQERLTCMKKCLKDLRTSVEIINPIENTDIVIEYQMKQNFKTNEITNVIVYEFINEANNVFIIKPTFKNSISFTETLKIQNYLDGLSTSNYRKNKEQTVDNMLFFLEKYALSDHLSGIKKSNYKDIADAFMQSIAYWLIFVNV